MVDAACVHVSILFAWSVDGLAVVGSARTVVYHRVTVVAVVWIGVGSVNAIVAGREGQGRITKKKRRNEQRRTW